MIQLLCARNRLSSALVIGACLFFVLALGLSTSLRNSALQRPPLFTRLPELGLHLVDDSALPPENDGAAQREELEEVEEPAWPSDGTIADNLTPEQHRASLENHAVEQHRVYSNMTTSGARFTFDFLDEGSYNPSLIPHPYKPETYIAVAQRDKQYDDNTFWNVQIACEATLEDDTMRCAHSPTVLPIASNVSPKCTGLFEYLNDVIGPHDARIFFGPEKPYIIYGLQSEYSCLGQWLQDLRRLVYWSVSPETNSTDDFFWPTDLQRPPPYGNLEKNWFAFWDDNGDMYLHYNLVPSRVFAQVSPDGSAGPDLAPLAEKNDIACMKKLMPSLKPTGLEWLHQGTNSLAVTLCRRADPDCEKRSDNTFVMTIFQKKTFYWHGVYYPHVLLFRQSAPFEVYGISSKPIWYEGRGEPGGAWRENTTKPLDQSEMIFTTALSWKEPGMTYHGYLDDTLFVAFGIEDQNSGAIDVVAEDLLAEMSLCDD